MKDGEKFIDLLSNVIYTQENIDRAKRYLSVRKIDFKSLKHPWVLTGSDISVFKVLGRYPVGRYPEVFINSLFVPIVDIEDDKELIGYDVRYCGDESNRLRFVKFKKNYESLFLYYTHNFSEIDKDCPVIITESAIDAESVRGFGLPVVSPLNAMNHVRFCAVLRAISSKIYVMYDNDETGLQSAKKIIKNFSVDKELSTGVKLISYTGKDPNYCLCNQETLFKSMVTSQL